MISAKGSFDFLSRLCVVGTALIVERIYWGGQFAAGEGVREACRVYQLYGDTIVEGDQTLGGKTISGGGNSSSATLNGCCIKSTVKS